MHRSLFSLPFFVCQFCLVVLALSGCSPQPNSGTQVSDTGHSAPTNAASKPEPVALFRNVAAQAGLKWKHELGNRGKFLFIEFTPAGCAFFDYDNDGFLDIFLVQSGSSEAPATVTNRPHCALYRNRRDGTFKDVTAQSGLDKDLGYAQGVAVGDYDNDGYDDLFITAYGGNHLFRNRRGSGKWEDVTRAQGLDKVVGEGYATSAAWGDYNLDGRLDLYVCYYARWTHAGDKQCRDKETGELDYCHPQLYDAVTHRLYRNAGARFVDVSEQSGITKVKGRGLAVAWIDYNNDMRPDIFVANDVTPMMLWRNEGNGRFTNVANQAGCAYDGEGGGIAGMGIAVADYDRSGRQSLYVSNFSSRPNILFKNLGGGFFEDATSNANLAASHLNFLSFGCEFFDYDADGWPDIITNNGHVQVRKHKRESGIPLKQRKQLLHNVGQGIFREITDMAALGDLAAPGVGRGLATGDYDNDGRIDVLAIAQNEPAQLFRNQMRTAHHWISFKAVGTKSNRNGIGARFEIVTRNGRQIAHVHGGSSYLSSSDRRVYFGLGGTSKVDQVIVRWPGGKRDVLKNLAANAFYTITEGRGITARTNPSQSHDKI